MDEKAVTWTFEINWSGEPDAGILSGSERVTVGVESGDAGGFLNEFPEFMVDMLEQWYDGANVYWYDGPPVDRAT